MKKIKSFLPRIISIVAANLVLGKPDIADIIHQRYPNISSLIKVGLNWLCFTLNFSKTIIPVTAIFESTNECNLSCLTCSVNRGMKRKKGFMDFNLYCQMLDLNRNISSIQLMNWGEPLLHPKIFEMIDYAKNKGLVVRIVTNGTILNDEKVKKLLDSNLDCLCISVDGATKKTYEKVRNYNYDKLEKTIKNLVKTRDVLKKNTFIEVSMVIFEETEKEIEAFRRKWFQVVDRVQIQPKMSSQNIKRTKKCFELWRGNPIILWDGTIVPCCVDAEGELGVGNIKHEKSLSKILNSDKMVKLRQGHIHNKFPTLCAFCNEYDSKKTSKRFQ